MDFKESQAWATLKWKIIKTCLAMANLRDGGIIVVGVSERDQTWQLDGISKEHLESFDTDDVVDQVNSYASPHIRLDLVIVAYKGQSFLAIQVHDFESLPIVCKKNGGGGLSEGAVYVRSPGKAETTRVTNAAEMHELMSLAAEIQARRIIEQGTRVRLKLPEPSSSTSLSQSFEAEPGDI